MKVGIYAGTFQSGKSEVCAVFEEYGFKKVSFAKTLKESLEVILYDLNVSEYKRYLYGDWKLKVIPELGITSRDLLVSYGTSYFRAIQNDIWVKCAENYMASHEQIRETNFVCDDLRFENEYPVFDITIKVVRPEQELILNEAEGHLDNFPFTYTIINDSTLEDLQIKTENLVRELLEYEN